MLVLIVAFGKSRVPVPLKGTGTRKETCPAVSCLQEQTRDELVQVPAPPMAPLSPIRDKPYRLQRVSFQKFAEDLLYRKGMSLFVLVEQSRKLRTYATDNSPTF